MTCAEARDQLDRFLAGSLESAERESVERHLTTCPECRRDLDSSQFLVDQVAGIRREVAPPSDLWIGIAPRIGRGVRRVSIPIWRLAAAAVVLVGATSALTVAVLRRPPVEVPVRFATTEASYQQTALELANLYQQVRDSLAPETRQVLERNLAVIERALSEAREALNADPANRTIEAIVVAAWQRKIEFLERAASLSWES